MGVQKKAKKIEKMVKNDFFQKSKKMPLSTPQEVLHSKFQVYSTKSVACGGGTDRHQTDTGRIQTFLAWPRYRIRSTYMWLLGETQRTGTGKGTRGEMGKKKVRAGWGGW